MARKMVFEWRPEAHISLDAQTVGERLEAIKKRQRGLLTPDAVIADARHKRSPLHTYFEWDDSEAAKRYRADQARYLIRHLVVTVHSPRMPDKPLRAYVHVDVPDNGKNRSGYMALQDALTDKEIRGQVLRRALSELKAWQHRYTELRELSRVFEAVEATAKDLELIG